MSAGRSGLRVLTFAPMVDSETVRLVARAHGLLLDERDHLFGWVSLLTLFQGGYGAIPLVRGPGFVRTGPWPLAQRLDARRGPRARLIPGGGLGEQVRLDWSAYNGGMGADTAIFAYYHLLPERALMAPIFAAPVPPREARMVPRVYGLLRGLFTLLLQLKPARAEAAGDRIRTLFDATDARIADGRPYLCGDRLTLGDIALAAAAGPLLLPPGYGALMPPVAAFPPPMRRLAEELRAHPTADFIDRLYTSGLD